MAVLRINRDRVPAGAQSRVRGRSVFKRAIPLSVHGGTLERPREGRAGKKRIGFGLILGGASGVSSYG